MKILTAIEAKRVFLNEKLDKAKTQLERNKLGQFATPAPLADSILELAQSLLPAGGKIRFLDPAFGTGSFYSALLRRFPNAQIEMAVGFEVDPHYGLEATQLWDDTPLQLYITDFTQAPPPNANEAKANLIICNPPYVRHHHMTKDEKRRLQRVTEQTVGIRLSGLAGFHCHFLCLSDTWMQEGGLAGWLIPSGFMDVNYGKPIKEYLLTNTTLLRVHRFAPVEVQFEDALVSSAVIWFVKTKPPANHRVKFTYGGSLTVPHQSQMISIEELRHLPKWTHCGVFSGERQAKVVNLEGLQTDSAPWGATNRDDSGFSTKPDRATPTLNLPGFNQELKLKDLFTIKRGLATGANNFFILNQEQIKQYQLPYEFLQPILPSPRFLKVDEIEADSEGNPLIERQLFLLKCHLPEGDVKMNYPSLWQYFQWGKELGIRERYLCQHRSPWYAQETRPPSPFLCTYMGRNNTSRSQPFRFILNHSQATAPNVYLMLYPQSTLQQAISPEKSLLGQVWQALNQISALSLLQESRVYGGGLYKLEPKELGLAPAQTIGQILLDYLYSPTTLFV